MRRWLPVVVTLGVVAPGAAAAQATGTTTFNAPYRAFNNSEFGVLISFPNGGGTAFEGVYRLSSDRFDIGFKGGMFDPSGAGSAELLLGTEARERVLTHSQDFPLDGALILGVGAHFVSGNSELIIRLACRSGAGSIPRAA